MSVKPPSNHSCSLARRKALLGALLAGTFCGVLLAVTSPGLPMAWDEGNAILRAEALTQGKWLYTTQIEGHPALYGIVIAAGRAVSAAWLSPLQSARLGPIALFSLAAGAMFYRLARERSLPAAVAGVAALVTLPRLFAHAHFASIDGPLTSCWILAWATFAAARTSRRGAVLWGVALGATLSAKATGWIAPIPFLLVTAAYRDRAGMKALGVGLPVAMLAFFVLNPPLWHEPIAGSMRFFELNLHRADQPGLNISTWFLGRMYNLDFPLPWYNTLFWTAVVVPSGTLVLAVVGLGGTSRRWRSARWEMLIVANWAILLVVRALPGAPPHDGVRLFLPSLAFLAALAGLGCDDLIGYVARRWPDRRRPVRIAGAAVLLVLLVNTVELVRYGPQWLSHYNRLIGGLPGATAAGMEPTYYWDALDASVLDWLHAHTKPDEKVWFAAGSFENLVLMQRWGLLRREISTDRPGTYRWYVIQHRPSAWPPVDRRLFLDGEAAYSKRLLGVPLVKVFAFEDYIEAVREQTQ